MTDTDRETARGDGQYRKTPPNANPYPLYDAEGNYKPVEWVSCPYCGGNGKQGRHGSQSSDYTPKTRRCLACGGDGKYPKRTESKEN